MLFIEECHRCSVLFWYLLISLLVLYTIISHYDIILLLVLYTIISHYNIILLLVLYTIISHYYIILLLVLYTINSHYFITGKDIVSFHDMVQGKDTSEICRMFAASLQLVHIPCFSTLSLLLIRPMIIILKSVR